jgi:glutaredoxin 3
MAQIEMYSTQTCPYCVSAKAFLEREGLPYREIDVTGDDAARAALVERAAGRRTVPQIFINGKPIGGYTDMVELKRTGEFDKLVAQPG